MVTCNVTAQLVEHLTAEQAVAGSIPLAKLILSVLKNWEMKVLALPCKQPDLCVAWINI